MKRFFDWLFVRRPADGAAAIVVREQDAAARQAFRESWRKACGESNRRNMPPILTPPRGNIFAPPPLKFPEIDSSLLPLPKDSAP